MSLREPKLFSYTSTGNKAPLRVDLGFTRYNVSLEPTASSAKIQHTYYPIEVVELDPSAVTWYDWPEGVVSVPTEGRVVGSITAIRVVVETGSDVTLVVSAEYE